MWDGEWDPAKFAGLDADSALRLEILAPTRLHRTTPRITRHWQYERVRQDRLQDRPTPVFTAGETPRCLCRRGSMGVCEKPPTMDFDLFVDLFFLVHPLPPTHPPTSHPYDAVRQAVYSPPAGPAPRDSPLTPPPPHSLGHCPAAWFSQRGVTLPGPPLPLTLAQRPTSALCPSSEFLPVYQA
jgi:hypothetical protein